MTKEGNSFGREGLPKDFRLTLRDQSLRLPDEDRLRRQRGHLSSKGCYLFLSDAGLAERLCSFDLLNAKANESNWDWDLRLGVLAPGSQFEVFEIVPAVDDLKDVLLGTPRLDFVRLQQAGSPADHLPKFGVAEDRLSEDKI